MLRSICERVFRGILLGFLTFLPLGLVAAKPAEINRYDVTQRMDEIMQSHAMYKRISPEIIKRSLHTFIENFDPSKVYFIKSEIDRWLEPSENMLEQMVRDYTYSRFPEYEKIFQRMQEAIKRRDRFEEQIDKEILPKAVSINEFKHPVWCTTEEELYTRLKKLRALQLATAEKANKDVRDIVMQRIKKERLKREEEILSSNKKEQEQLLYTSIIKAMASSLDTHTVYFTPNEANQFLVSIQQRLLGIGVQLRDDVDGFTIAKVIEGGPADKQGELKARDKIVAIDGESVVGLDVSEVIEMIQGGEGTKVVLTVVRPEDEKTIDIVIVRGEVVLKDTRLEARYEPYADGVIAYLVLHSFYQDENSSSTQDLEEAFSKIAREHKVKGVILDLRFNAGGILNQAVDVAGLFMKKGVVVSIKDEAGRLQHLRDFNSTTMWDGPLFILVNRFSASAAEIVAQTLQDYGRAVIVGDDHTYGKGSFQTFTLATHWNCRVDPKGEHKVTRGRYYTVSGKTPQLVGVKSDIIIPSGFSFMEIGEEYATYPLTNDSIASNFEDRLQDIPLFQRARVRELYGKDAQKKLTHFAAPLVEVKQNSEARVAANKEYQKYLQHMKDLENGVEEMEPISATGDFQLQETFSTMKDYLWFLEEEQSGTGAESEAAA